MNRGPRPPPDATTAINPVIVVKVLSASTRSVDSSETLVDYFRVPSIQHYLIVRSRRQEIIYHRRLGDKIVPHTVNVDAIRLDPPRIMPNVADGCDGRDG